ncbi:MAG: aspartate/glutamate racemase family protein [Bifidobacteriaceae bacterium]|jgi:allantoin racemase|nr:aspartate/glutamate racemase family protein [Bifidobacteriaceae bacterium]
MRILNIIPITTDIWTEEIDAYVRRPLLPDTDVVTSFLTHGPASIECQADEALAAPWVVALIRQAERDGFDGVFVNCFGDPGILAARDLVSIPVFGGFEPAVLAGLGLAEKVSVVAVLPQVVSLISGNIQRGHFGSRIASLRHLSLSVPDLCNTEALIQGLYEQSKAAIEEDGAGAIVVGCAALAGVAEGVAARLRADGLEAPVIEPTRAGLLELEAFVRMGWHLGHLAHRTPRLKERPWRLGAGTVPLAS